MHCHMSASDVVKTINECKKKENVISKNYNDFRHPVLTDLLFGSGTLSFEIKYTAGVTAGIK